MMSRSQEEWRPLAWAATAFGTGVLLHADRLTLWTLAATAACLAWRLLGAAGIVSVPRKPIRIALALGLMSAVYLQFRTLNGLTAGTALLVVMGAIKLLETHARRDRGIVIGTALFLLLAACLDRQSLTRAPLYLAHAWLCCSAFAVNAHDGRGMSNRAALALAGRTLALAAPLATVLFVFFPRVAGSFWALPQSTQATTGLGDSMSPGSISLLTESYDPAFRVSFAGSPPPAEQLYWRGPVLQEFDGYTWMRAPGRFFTLQPLEYLGPAYKHTITLEPNSRPWWFALDTVLGSPDRRVFFTADYQLIANEPVTRQVTYEVVSHTRTQQLAPLSTLGRRYNTTLPSGRNERSATLARRMRAEAGSDALFVAAVLERFRTGGFEYTLTPPLLDHDSVDDFLFNTKRGFCGHYASAFTSLMRAAGLPSRVVTGYLGGEWNPIGEFFIVRQSDAHAWSEVWLEGRGWARIDPTAVVAPERLRRGIFDLLPGAATAQERLLRGIPWLAQARQGWQALNAWWDESIVKLDLRKQLALLERVGIEAPDWRHLAWALSGGLILWLMWMAWQLGRSARRQPMDALATAYVALCRKLARTGLARAPHQGPLAYAHALAAFRPDIADRATPLLQRYADLRYGTALDAASFVRQVGLLRAPRPSPPFPPAWRALLTNTVPLYARMPADLRLRLEPLTRTFLDRVQFVGCNGLVVTDDMRVTVAVQACLLIVRSGASYDDLRSVLLYPDEFLVEESDVDEAGVVSEGTRVLSGQALDTSRIVLSWRDVLDSGTAEEAYNVVLHEFAHHLDHSIGGALTEGASRNGTGVLANWHAVLEKEYDELCDAVERGEPTLIDPYGAEHLAEFFAVATETFFELPGELKRAHPRLYAELARFYGLDVARWGDTRRGRAHHGLP
jgi:Mlc titration factor MtfA (ptsG expression regulator)/transglutaminase-like putative cysteine protease